MTPRPITVRSIDTLMSRRDASMVNVAARLAADRLDDVAAGRVRDHRRRVAPTHAEILVPDDAPDRMRDRATLWNEVEHAELHRDARLAWEATLAFPPDLSPAARLDAARRFALREVVGQGLPVDLTVHASRPAPGTSSKGAPKAAEAVAILLVPLRRVTPEGLGPRHRPLVADVPLVVWRNVWEAEVDAARRPPEATGCDPADALMAAEGAAAWGPADEALRDPVLRALAAHSGRHPAHALAALAERLGARHHEVVLLCAPDPRGPWAGPSCWPVRYAYNPDVDALWRAWAEFDRRSRAWLVERRALTAALEPLAGQFRWLVTGTGSVHASRRPSTAAPRRTFDAMPFRVPVRRDEVEAALAAAWNERSRPLDPAHLALHDGTEVVPWPAGPVFHTRFPFLVIRGRERLGTLYAGYDTLGREVAWLADPGSREPRTLVAVWRDCVPEIVPPLVEAPTHGPWTRPDDQAPLLALDALHEALGRVRDALPDARPVPLPSAGWGCCGGAAAHRQAVRCEHERTSVGDSFGRRLLRPSIPAGARPVLVSRGFAEARGPAAPVEEAVELILHELAHDVARASRPASHEPDPVHELHGVRFQLALGLLRRRMGRRLRRRPGPPQTPVPDFVRAVPDEALVSLEEITRIVWRAQILSDEVSTP